MHSCVHLEEALLSSCDWKKKLTPFKRYCGPRPSVKQGDCFLLTGFSCHADSSRRAFYKEFVKVVDAADVIIEVLDARDPLATRCTDVERYVRKRGAEKKLILLLNKIGRPLTPTMLIWAPVPSVHA